MLFPDINPMIAQRSASKKRPEFPSSGNSTNITSGQIDLLLIDIDQLLLLATNKSLMLILTDLKLKSLHLLHN